MRFIFNVAVVYALYDLLGFFHVSPHLHADVALLDREVLPDEGLAQSDGLL